jgi:hypothetical protein
MSAWRRESLSKRGVPPGIERSAEFSRDGRRNDWGCLARRTGAGEARVRLGADHEALGLSEGERKASFHGLNIGSMLPVFKSRTLYPGKSGKRSVKQESAMF